MWQWIFSLDIDITTGKSKLVFIKKKPIFNKVNTW